MNTLSSGGFAQKFLARVMAVKRRTWIIIGLGLAVIFALVVWAFIAIVGALWGSAQTLVSGAPAILQEAQRVAAAKAEVFLPAAQEKLSQIGAQIPSVDPALASGVAVAVAAATAAAAATGARTQAVPANDVAGSDLGPTRFTGLVRIGWLRDGKIAEARYQGSGDYPAVLQHYIQGFIALGFAHGVLSASTSEETHEFTNATERMTLTVNGNAPVGAAQALARKAMGQSPAASVSVVIKSAPL